MPDLINIVLAFLGTDVHLPEGMLLLSSKIAGTASAVMFIMSNLGIQRPVFKHDSGETVTLIDGDRTNLPFTDKKENKLPAVEIPKTEETNLYSK